MLTDPALGAMYRATAIIAYKHSSKHYVAFVKVKGVWLLFDDLQPYPIPCNPFNDWPRGFAESMICYRRKEDEGQAGITELLFEAEKSATTTSVSSTFRLTEPSVEAHLEIKFPPKPRERATHVQRRVDRMFKSLSDANQSAIESDAELMLNSPPQNRRGSRTLQGFRRIGSKLGLNKHVTEENQTTVAADDRMEDLEGQTVIPDRTSKRKLDVRLMARRLSNDMLSRAANLATTKRVKVRQATPEPEATLTPFAQPDEVAASEGVRESRLESGAIAPEDGAGTMRQRRPRSSSPQVLLSPSGSPPRNRLSGKWNMFSRDDGRKASKRGRKH